MTYPELKLISFSMCPFVQRARIVLNEKSIPHEIEFIDLSMPPDWFFDVSPLEKVPVLLVDGEPLFESMVICDFLDEISDGSLYPASPFMRAQNRSWIGFADGLLDTVFDLIHAEDEATFKRAKGTIVDRLDVLEEQLDNNRFYAGDNFSMVDVAFASIFRFLTGIARYTDMDLFEDVPQIKSWSENVLDHPAVQQSMPEGYMDKLKTTSLAKPDTIIKGMIK